MSLRVLDLFAGCGGLSCGFELAGFEIVAACEIDEWAALSYEANHEDVNLIVDDIKSADNHFWESSFRKRIDIIIGGPPCQGFSVSGNRQYGILNESNFLVDDFLRVVQAISPEHVVIENVKGIKSGKLTKSRKAFEYIKNALHELGYNVYANVLNAQDFGVASSRSRVFIIGSKHRFEVPPFLTKTHSINKADGLKSVICVKDAISDLPVLSAGEGVEDGQKYRTRSQNSYQKEIRNGSRSVFNHVAMKHSQRLVERFDQMKPGDTSFRLGADSKGKRITTYKTNNQRLYPEKIAPCVTANFQSTFVHYEQSRNLTAREAARLMSFSDTFIFKGKRTQMSSKFLKKYGRENEDFLSQYNQIGNSVPPLLAKAVAEGLLRAIESSVDLNVESLKNFEPHQILLPV